jgi:nucleoside-diphosphate-sugar epimerase
MKALITGGAGFIGSHIAEALCRKGASVVVLDNLSLGNLDNLAWKQPGDNLEFVEGDIRDEALLAKLMPGIDWVFHEGALPSVPRSVAQPIESHDHTLNGSLKVLVAARDAGVKRLVFASSSSIYGDSDAPAKHESLPPNPSPLMRCKNMAVRSTVSFSTASMAWKPWHCVISMSSVLVRLSTRRIRASSQNTARPC